MRKGCCVVAVFAVLLQAAYAGEAPAEAPKIQFESLQHDFGQVAQFTPNEHVFKFKNEGTAILRIERVHANCGCTAALVSQDSLEPGEAGELKVTFNSQDFAGEVHKSVTVTSNDPERKDVILQIKANVIADLVCTPLALNFREVGTANAPSELVVKAFSPSGKKFKIVSATPSADYLKAEIVDPQKDEDPYQVRVTVAGNPPTGMFNATVLIQTDLDKTRPITISVTGNVLSRTEVTPPKIFFGVVCTGDTVSRSLLVKANSWEGLKVEKVESPDCLTVATEETKPGKEWKVTVQIKDAAAKAGDKPAGNSTMLKEKIKLFLNDPTMRQAEVMVYALVRDCK
ncbi:MAG TPA: DUF1573 domain-containing protein [Planctomycetota bacterium]|nr:DUF1573 domain-containing protein [Planctomycetota bacterium]